MAVLFADQVGLFNQEGKAEFEVRRPGDKLLEGVRVFLKIPKINLIALVLRS
jgi:hypothetical protein